MKFFGEAPNKIEHYEWAKDCEKNVKRNEKIFGKEWYYYKKEI